MARRMTSTAASLDGSDGANPPSSPWPGGVALVVEDRPQRPEDLGAGAERLRVRLEADRHDHELLEVRGVLGVLAAVEDVEHRDRQDPGADAAEVAVERQVVRRRRRVGAGERHAEDRVGPERALVGRPVDVDEGGVDAGLVRRVEAQQRRRDDVGDVRRPRSGRPCRRTGSCRRRAARPPRGRRSRRRMARPRGPTEPSSRTTSTSTVGLPRESRISRASMKSIAVLTPCSRPWPSPCSSVRASVDPAGPRRRAVRDLRGIRATRRRPSRCGSSGPRGPAG